MSTLTSIGLRLYPGQRQALETIAKKTYHTKSGLIRLAIAQLVDRWKNEQRTEQSWAVNFAQKPEERK